MDSSWNDVPRLIVDAFELKDAHGTELLERLGTFDLWSGDLAQMRSDQGREGTDAADSPQQPANVDRFRRALAVSRSIDYLESRCAEVLHLHYLQGVNAIGVARKFEITERLAERLIQKCTKRLFEVAESVLAAKPEETRVTIASRPVQELEPVPSVTSSDRRHS